MIIIYEIVLIVLAAVFKAVADTVADHYDVSIFKGKHPAFWDKTTAAQYAPFLRFTKFRLDAWHLANFAMIFCFCLCAVIHKPILHWFIELVIAGVIFNVVFNFFYNKALRK